MISILHIIERFAGAGPDRALIAAATTAAQLGLHQQHTVCALEAAASPITLWLAQKAGITVHRQPDGPTLQRALAAADIVVVHFWNNPALYEFLRAELPPLRLVIWATVYGHKAPQVITPALVAFADQFLVKAPGVLALPALNAAPLVHPPLAPQLVYSPLDVGRLAGYRPRAHATFNVGYIGTVNFAKMHAGYVPMSAGVDLPNVRFVVCGGGIEQTLAAQAVALGVADRFDFRSYVHNVLPVLEELDLFGYPLCADTYATTERALQEAMWVGIPPVVFPYAGLATLVQHEQTGLVVHTEREYQQAIEHLYYHPAERQRLGQNASQFVRATFDPGPIIEQLDSIYRQLLRYPKRARHWTGAGNTPAEWFVQALGDQGEIFARSLHGTAWPDLLSADETIAQASPLLQGGEGGVIHYRNYYPDDAHLRLWAGLLLERQGKLAQALAEYQAAVTLGLPHWRALWYSARLAEQLQQPDQAIAAAQSVVAVAPEFAAARELLARFMDAC